MPRGKCSRGISAVIRLVDPDAARRSPLAFLKIFATKKQIVSPAYLILNTLTVAVHFPSEYFICMFMCVQNARRDIPMAITVRF